MRQSINVLPSATRTGEQFTEPDGRRRVECACGTHLRTYALPFGDDRGTFRAVCRECGTQWIVPLQVVLADADPALATIIRLDS